MKKVKCGNEKCSGMKQYYDIDLEDWVNRKHQMVEVPDDFDERKKVFCSFTCACWAGYMTMNKKHFLEKGGIEVNGSWWIKDPSNGLDPRFSELNKDNKNEQ